MALAFACFGGPDGLGRYPEIPPLKAWIMSKQPSLSYKDAGVDIDAGEALVERIKSEIGRAHV